MKRIRLIAVGRLRVSFWREAAAEYAQRLKHSFRLEETIIKDGNASLSADKRSELEGAAILAALKPNETVICLDEHGQSFPSTAFATFIDALCDGPATPCFIIGGAYGLSPAVLHKARHTVSMGPMTFPHELARVLLLEQLYRADSILRKSPYHHE